MRVPDIDGALLFGLMAAFMIAGLTIVRPGGPTAPGGPGLCWIETASDDFKIFRRDIANMESCASRLEGLFLQSGLPVSGAYGGLKLHIDADGMWADLAHTGHRSLIVLPGTRGRIDAIIQSGANADINVQ